MKELSESNKIRIELSAIEAVMYAEGYGNNGLRYLSKYITEVSEKIAIERENDNELKKP